VCAAGTCAPGAPVPCDDNEVCTTDACAPEVGCVFVPNVGPCSDGNACTGGDTCAGGSCAPGAPIACDDNDPCTQDSCSPAQGCVSVPQSGGACTPLPDGVFCGASGPAGTVVRCAIRVARAKQVTPAPTAVQFSVQYPAAAVKALRFVDTICLDPDICFEADVPPASLYPSGHTLVPSPGNVSSWVGTGAVSAFHAQAPTTPLTPAFVQNGAVSGDSSFVELEVELLSAAPANAPVYLSISNIVGATATAAKMLGQATNGTIILDLESCAGVAGACDDENPCTVDSCDAVSGACAHVPLICSDGNACNGLETCNPQVGCLPGAPPVCDDGAVCTTDSCNPATGCVNLAVVCSDGNLCNGAESCHPTFGCQAGLPLQCADGDPCTVDTCSAGQGCVFLPSAAPQCLPSGVFCSVSGAAGQVVSCPLRIARANQATPAPVSAQLTLHYSPALLEPIALQDQFCLGPQGLPPCVPVSAPPAVLHPSGHSVVTIPGALSAWGGEGSLVVFNPTAAQAPITPAYLHNGALLGDAQFLVARFQLKADIPASAPHALWLDGLVASTAQALPMQGEVVAGTAVFALAQCTAAPGACNDGNACTADGCDPLTAKCVYTAVDCSDGNACNGAEVCSPALGCVAGSPLQCNDGDPCTVDTCEPASGCAHAPVECSDGNACNGAEVCTAGACTSGAPLNCDDGDACTVDSCAQLLGCQHAPLGTPECLPAGALCALSGAAGSEHTCTIQVARASAATPAPASFQAKLNYDPAHVQVLGFEDTLCLGEAGAPPCLAVSVPPAVLEPSGHQAVLVPAQLSAWAGSGNLVLFHPAAPSTALSNAVHGAGGVVGDAAVLTLRVRLMASVEPVAPQWVSMSGVKGATGAALPMTGAVLGGVAVMSLADCTQVAGVCNDGDPCTVDTCNPTSKQCEASPKVCSDGNACNGAEACNPTNGACLPAFPLVCNDGNACTVDACDPALGCTHTALACDDGNPCNGAETCLPASGCAPGAPLDCADGDPCTIDSCAPASGCAHVPDAASGCLPLGAICAVSGPQGATVSCPISLARASLATPEPASAQFTLEWSQAQLHVLGLSDTLCLGPDGDEPCFPSPVPPGTLQPTGHTVVLAPNDATTWDGEGGVVIFHAQAPGTPLSSAAWSAGAVVGDAEIVQLELELAQTIPASAPAYVWASNAKGATGAAQAMKGAVVQGVITLSISSCVNAPAVCQDNNACTVDSCDAATGVCAHAPVSCSDGNACNGAETCAPLTGCGPGAPLLCADADPCTTNTCEPATGCVVTPTACSDGNACNGLEVCAAGAGCAPGTAPDCTDGSACTLDLCAPATGCVNAPVECSDGDACNGLETCQPAQGCLPGTALNCDDGDACTTDACAPQQGCVHTPLTTDACLPAGALCALVGAADQELDCPVRVARLSQATPAPTSLQLAFAYPTTRAQAVGFFDTLCVGDPEPCFEVQTPSSPLAPRGHSVVLVPAALSNWAGAGSFVAFHGSAPSTPVSQAAWVAGAVQGDPEIAVFRVRLLADAPALAPVYVTLTNAKGATATAQPMTGSVQAGVALLGLEDCGQAPEACDDGNGCTVDSCNTSTGLCVWEPVSCDDLDACTGVETCDPTSGACEPGAPLLCDDGDPCTQDECAPEYGCMAPPVVCSDGDPCNGLETCQGGACSAGVAPNCEDTDPCTLDSCAPGEGCVHAPSLDAACLPPGVLCGLVGAAGTTLSCPLTLARVNEATPEPASMQVQLTWSAASAQIAGFFDTLCLGPDGTEPCLEQAVPPGTVQPSAHVGVLVPAQLTQWTGTGSLVLFQSPGGTLPLSSAFIGAGGLFGDAHVLDARFQLTAPVPATAPVWVSLSGITASTFDAKKMTGAAHQGLVVVKLQSCTGAGAVCEDHEPCTDDACVAGACAYSAHNCSDGSVCTGIESCAPAVGCAAGTPLDCDDGDACTVDSCHPALGCIHTLLVCDDGDACNGLEWCDPQSGCASGAALDCDDGNACTDEWCNPNSGCWSIPVLCSDGDPCNGLELCDPASGCLAPTPPPSCDDANACTVDACEAGVGCVHWPSTAWQCLPPGVCCGITGALGEEVVCPLRVARGQAAGAPPASLQLELSYSPTALEVAGITDTLCFGEGGTEPCATVDVPPQALDPTGHTVNPVPANLAAWQGQGGLVIFHPASPATALSNAVFTAGAVQGDAHVLDLRFELLASIPQAAPEWLECSDIVGSTGAAQKLTGQAQGGVVVLD
jgi:hypothetical protein